MISTFGRTGKKLLVAAVAATVGLASSAALVPGVAGAAQTVTTQRYAGSNRYGTAAAVAAAAFPAGSNNMIVASGENYPDGLAAATLAGAIGGPILLTSKASLNQETSNALGTIDGGAAGPGTVWVVGGTAAVSDNVRAQLKALGYTGATLKEIGGATRYETAAAVAASAAAVQANVPYNGLRTAIVASGQNFPDALSAGAVAYVNKMPILLTQTASLNASTKSALTARSIQQVLIAGGTAAVSDAAKNEIAAMGISVIRVAGVDRFDTAYQLGTLLAKSLATGGFGFESGPGVTTLDPTGDAGVDQIVLASGLNFPDALSASPLAGVRQAPILLTASVPDKTKQFGIDHASTLDNVAAVGGTGVISDADLATEKDSATTKTPTVTITANAGSNTWTAVFSEDVPTGVSSPANYLLNNVASPGGTTVTGYNSITRTVTITFPAATTLVAGDVVTVKGASICTTDATPRCVGTTSKTVAADTTKPTATVKAFTGSTQAFVIFSEPVTTASGNPANDLGAADLTGGTVLTQYTPTVFKFTVPAPAQGASFTLDTTWSDLSGNHPATTFSTTAVTDSAPPALSTATGLTLPFTQAADVVNGVTVTAKKGAAADGAAGNAWSVTLSDNNGALNVGVDTTNKVISINSDLDNGAGQQTSKANVAAALTGNSTFAGLFTASQTAGGAFGPGGAGNTSLAGGSTFLTVLTGLTEGVDAGTTETTDFALDTNGDSIAEVGAAAVLDETNAHNGSLIVSFLTGSPAISLTAGTSKLRVVGAFTDLSGLNAVTVPSSITIS